MSCLSEWQLRKLRGSLELPPTQRAWLCKGKVGNPVTCWLVRMHLNDSAHLIRYKFMFVCTPLESELHFKESSMLTLASPMEPGRGFPVICMQHSHLPHHAQNWLANINRKLFTIGKTLYTDLLQISSVTLSLDSPRHSQPLAGAV